MGLPWGLHLTPSALEPGADRPRGAVGNKWPLSAPGRTLKGKKVQQTPRPISLTTTNKSSFFLLLLSRLDSKTRLLFLSTRPAPVSPHVAPHTSSPPCPWAHPPAHIHTHPLGISSAWKSKSVSCQLLLPPGLAPASGTGPVPEARHIPGEGTRKDQRGRKHCFWSPLSLSSTPSLHTFLWRSHS